MAYERVIVNGKGKRNMAKKKTKKKTTKKKATKKKATKKKTAKKKTAAKKAPKKKTAKKKTAAKKAPKKKTTKRKAKKAPARRVMRVQAPRMTEREGQLAGEVSSLVEALDMCQVRQAALEKKIVQQERALKRARATAPKKKTKRGCPPGKVPKQTPAQTSTGTPRGRCIPRRLQKDACVLGKLRQNRDPRECTTQVSPSTAGKRMAKDRWSQRVKRNFMNVHKDLD